MQGSIRKYSGWWCGADISHCWEDGQSTRLRVWVLQTDTANPASKSVWSPKSNALLSHTDRSSNSFNSCMKLGNP